MMSGLKVSSSKTQMFSSSSVDDEWGRDIAASLGYARVEDLGLGLKQSKVMNEALLMKLGWVMLTKPSTLWVRVMCAKYNLRPHEMSGAFTFPKGSVCLNAVAKVWAQEPLINMARVRPPEEMLHEPVAAFVTRTGEWWWEKFETFLPTNALLIVAAVMPPSSSARADRMIWGYTSNGAFSTRTPYKALSRRVENNVRPLWKAIWKAPAAQRVRHFLWLASRDRLFTNMERARRHMADDIACLFCGLPESTTHVLRDCEKARRLWLQLIPSASRRNFFSQDVSVWLWVNLGLHESIIQAIRDLLRKEANEQEKAQPIDRLSIGKETSRLINGVEVGFHRLMDPPPELRHC
ncbi:Unknown protein [Striga hermonthica]|uniref:Reverse transcriptase zinc-binding domain-containing protein n=1 Tax=Striga hermonthica TaxID=68872 RepID=A0A9N7MN08_STRHE|nr:Unknown protein [Striga hermonthica]